MFVNDAFIGDVTAPARGTDLVVLSACMMMLVTSFGQSVGNAVDRLATVSLAGAFIFMGFPTAYPTPSARRTGRCLCRTPRFLAAPVWVGRASRSARRRFTGLLLTWFEVQMVGEQVDRRQERITPESATSARS